MYAESGGHFEKWPPFCFWRDILKPPYLKVFVGRITTNPASFMLLSSTEQLSLKSALLLPANAWMLRYVPDLT